jgi:hypothetical protein
MNDQQAKKVYSEAQERQARLTRSFFERAIGDPRNRTERTLDGRREPIGQARHGRWKDRRVLAQEAMNAYAGFLDSLFLHYRENARVVERGISKAESVTG